MRLSRLSSPAWSDSLRVLALSKSPVGNDPLAVKLLHPLEILLRKLGPGNGFPSLASQALEGEADLVVPYLGEDPALFPRTGPPRRSSSPRPPSTLARYDGFSRGKRRADKPEGPADFPLDNRGHHHRRGGEAGRTRAREKDRLTDRTAGFFVRMTRSSLLGLKGAGRRRRVLEPPKIYTRLNNRYDR